MFDYLIVGAGFSGAVLAERLASQLDKKVLLIDRRNHIGGNAYDCKDEIGIMVHTYGPHIFHTNSQEVYDYLSQFTAWRLYTHRVKALVQKKLVPFPINHKTIRMLRPGLIQREVEGLLKTLTEPVLRRKQAKSGQEWTMYDEAAARFGSGFYEEFFLGYTKKHWGIDPELLDPSVIRRIPVRDSQDDRYFDDTYQCMPRKGYTAMFQRMLAHHNIRRMLGASFESVPSHLYRRIIYTGPIDEFCQYLFGRLAYRSVHFEFRHYAKKRVQEAAVINYPDPKVPYTRSTEFKYLTGQRHPHSTVVYEYPTGEGDPYYPVPQETGRELYRRYQTYAASAFPQVRFVGRLGRYQYLNMDQCVAQALKVFEEIKDRCQAGAE